jgi:hypothetical protein
VGHAECMVEMRVACNFLVGKPEGKRPLRRPKSRWEGVEWIHLSQHRDQWRIFVNMVMNLRVP